MTTKNDSREPTPAVRLRSWAERYAPAIRTRFRAVRTALRKRLPTANELAYDYGNALVISYAPADKGIDGIVAIRVSAEGVALYFNQATQLPDPKRLLKGAGKQARFMALESAGRLAHPDVNALIVAAIRQARVGLPATGKGSLVIKSAR